MNAIGKSHLVAGAVILAAALQLRVAHAGPGAAAQPASSTATAAFRDIKRTFGFVPGFFPSLTPRGRSLAGAADLQLDPETALGGKVKELIGLAVAAQIPFRFCIYVHAVAAIQRRRRHEINEAIAIAATARHSSTMLNGLPPDEAAFPRRESIAESCRPADARAARRR